MRKPKVLVVDDAIYMRAVIEELLLDNGYEVLGLARNGLEGVQMYEELYESGNSPDLVLMDITMKKMDGLEALKRIMKIDNKAKVIMCSSIKQKDAIVNAIELGAEYFIYKPFEDEEMLDVLKKVLNKR